MLKLIVIFFLFLFTSVQSQGKENTQSDTITQELERLNKFQEKAYKLGRFDTFKLYTDSILTLAEAHGYKKIKIDAIIRLGVYHARINAYDESLTYYLQALELSKEVPEGYKKRTVVLINIGNLYNVIGYHNKAKEAFNEAKNYIDQFDGPDMYKMAVYMGLSESSSANKNFKGALEYLDKAQEIGEKLKRNDVLIAVFNAMGENYLLLKNYNQSLAYGKKAEALYTKEQSAERRSLSLYVVGASLVGLKNYKDAIQPLQMAQGTAATNGYLKIQMDTHKQLATAYEKQGDLEKANIQQKGFINAQKKYLLSLHKAKRLEVEKNLEDTALLLQKEHKSKWKFILLACILIFILLVILFVYRKKKKQAQLEAHQLKESQILLKDENEILKIKIYKLAQRKKEVSIENNVVNLGLKKTSLTQKDQDKYVQHILEYMEEEHPYLDHEINQSTLAEKLEMSVHLLSEVLNICFEKNFNNFINLYRVDRAKQLMKSSKYKHYKILAIGYESGFSSKTSFNRVFKQLVEQTPSEYRRQQLIKDTDSVTT